MGGIELKKGEKKIMKNSQSNIYLYKFLTSLKQFKKSSALSMKLSEVLLNKK